MTVQTEDKNAGDFILSQANGSRSRETITVLLGEKLKASHVLGRKLLAPTVAAAVAVGTNVGNGTVTGQAVAADGGVQRGGYRMVCIEPVAAGGIFAIYDPSGRYLGDASVGTAFAKEITFTINDGAVDFAAGDAFEIKVTGGTYKYKEYDPADADGGQRASGILYDEIDATAADKVGAAVVRDAEVRSADLTWFTGATQAQKDEALDALAVLRIIGR